MLDHDDNALILLLAGGAGCSLDSSPGENWVERSGGLPQYICKIAKAVMGSGKSKSSAIAIAISRTKKWAAGGDGVDADTKAKAAKAVAEWTALKAKNKAKQVVKASREDGTEYLMLCGIGSFNTDMVRRAWDDSERSRRNAAREQRAAELGIHSHDIDSPVPYSYIKEMWTDYLIVSIENYGTSDVLARVPYSVSGNVVVFGPATEVEQQYVEVENTMTLSAAELALLSNDLKVSASKQSHLEVLANLLKK